MTNKEKKAPFRPKSIRTLDRRTVVNPLGADLRKKKTLGILLDAERDLPLHTYHVILWGVYPWTPPFSRPHNAVEIDPKGPPLRVPKRDQ